MTGTIKKWQIYSARVKFEDSDEIKERPVLIMNNVAFVISAFKMTGTNRGDVFPEHQLRDWKPAGLSKPTSVRLDKALKLNDSDLVSYIGELSITDRYLIEMKLSK